MLFKSRIKEEKATVEKMIRLYCRKMHKRKELCLGCTDLQEYAFARLNKCLFGQNKPVCSKCPVHCYKPDYKEIMREVMRFSGPRMIFSSPILSLLHLYRSYKS
jgi:hypothetical protein